MIGQKNLYHLAGKIIIRPGIPTEQIRRNVKFLVDSNSQLRSTFTLHRGEPVQVIHRNIDIFFEVVYPGPEQWSKKQSKQKAGINCDNGLEQEIITAASLPFDLEKGPLIRFHLFHCSDTKRILLICMHHIISDGWSAGLVFRYLNTLFVSTSDKIKMGAQKEYKDFVIEHKSLLNNAQGRKAIKYWKEELGKEIIPVQFPFTGKELSPVPGHGTVKQMRLPMELFSDKDFTPFTIIASIIFLFLHKLTGQSRIYIAIPVLNRINMDFMRILGNCANTVIIVSDFSPVLYFRDLLVQINKKIKRAREHQIYPLYLLKEKLNIKNSPWLPLLTNVFVSYAKIKKVKRGLSRAVEFEPVPLFNVPADFGLQVYEDNKGMIFEFHYNDHIFSPRAIDQTENYLHVLVRSIIEQPGALVRDLEIIPRDEKKSLFRTGYTQTRLRYNKDFAALFEDQVQKRPEKEGVKFCRNSLTYTELKRKANQLAHFIMQRGIKKENSVGIYMNRSPDLIIAILACFKTGAVYVPLHPSLPIHRLEYIINDSGLTHVITNLELGQVHDVIKGLTVLNVDRDREIISLCEQENPDIILTPRSPAYIMYTSGTTGVPRGVTVEQRGIGNLIQAQLDILGLTHDERILQFAEIDFDASVWEITMALLSGNTLVMCDREVVESPSALKQFLRKEGITIVTLPPVMLSQMETGIPGLRTIISAGEPCTMDIVRKWDRPGLTFFNAYGPTEGTVCTTMGQVKGTDKKITIGTPLPNIEVFLVDKYCNLVPRGCKGEICISGISLARGYLHPGEIKNNPFTPHPFPEFSHANSQFPGMYRTGDLGRWDKLGKLEFHGRIDRQIKLSGYRIELSEIESVINKQDGIVDSLVLLSTGRNPRLAGFIQSTIPDIKGESIQDGLKKELPIYMVPPIIIPVASWPLTSHGKKDTDVLQKMIHDHLTVKKRKKQAPRTMLEESLLEIWQDILQTGDISMDDNFFKLGGNSLQMARIITRIRGLFSMDLSFHTFFDNPTIASLARGIRDRDKDSSGDLIIPCRQKQDARYLDLSLSQERMWFLHYLEPGSIAYNITVAVKLFAPVDERIIGKSLDRIVERHESLRTSFTIYQDRPVQTIHKTIDEYYKFIDISHSPDKEKEEQRILKEEALFLFDLGRCPLFKITEVKVREIEHVFILNIHHIISDQWSLGNFIYEINELYRAFSEKKEPELPRLPLQYPDYAVWQKKQYTKEYLKEDIHYWKNKLKDLPVLTLTQDKIRPGMQTYVGAYVILPLDNTIIEKINYMNGTHNVTGFMILLSAFYVLLHRYSGMKDIPVGIPHANRSYTEIENLIGTFVNTLVLRILGNGELSFSTLLHRVKEICIEAFEHRRMPFHTLVEIMDFERDTSHLPLVQVFFNVANAPLSEKFLGKYDWEIIPLDESGVQFDLTLTIELKKMKQMVFSYNTDLFNEDTIHQMATHYRGILETIVDNPGMAIGRIPLLRDGELKQILHTWNATTSSYPGDSTFSREFEKVVNQFPDKPALCYGTDTYTYGQVNKKSNHYAWCLKSMGVGPEKVVGVFADRSYETLAAIIGIIKAGGTFLPLDPDYPPERISYMIADSAASFLLTDTPGGQLFKGFTGTHIHMDDIIEDIEYIGKGNLPSIATPDTDLYIIYTSGSTGNPKGVQIPHKAVLNFLFSMKKEPGLEEDDAVLALTPLSFDIAYLELFLPLLTGALLILAGKEERKDGFLLKKLIQEKRPALVQATPSTWRMLFEAGWGWDPLNKPEPGNEQGKVKKILCGGEPMDLDLAEKLYSAADQVWNMYGPTETTIWSTLYRLPYKGAPVRIGKPIDNTEVFILDSLYQPVPIGVTGEIYIGGHGLAKGYIFKQKITEKNFITITLPDKVSRRLYRTGDLGSYKRDGNIEFFGRVDSQVKFHGHRIELGEIDYWLSSYPGIVQSVTLVRNTHLSEKILVSYVISNSDDEGVMTGGILAYLKDKLPGFMIPGKLIYMKSFPHTPNNKIDKKRLPVPVFDRGKDKEFIAPSDELEEKIITLWKEVLGIQTMSMDDSFFDMGGHSLLAVRLISAIQSAFSLSIPLRRLFDTPTPGGFAHMIREQLFLTYKNPGQNDSEKLINRECLFGIQKGTARLPLFIIIGMFRNENNIYRYCINIISHLDSSIPVYGLRPRGLFTPSSLYNSAAEIARDFVDEIKKVQPHGPYFLIGECVGGIIAYETAQQLQARGDQVGHLILLDTYFPFPITAARNTLVRVTMILNKFRAKIKFFFTCSFKEIVKRVKAYLKKQLQRFIIKGKKIRELQWIEKVNRNYYLLARNYRPEIYSGKITLIINETDYKVHPYLYWNRLYPPERGNPDSFTIRIVHGTHTNRLLQYGDEVSTIITAILDNNDQ